MRHRKTLGLREISAWPLFGIVLVVAGLTGCGPIWYLDTSFAQRLARQEKKPLLLYFKTWDSTQHRNMKLHVFENGAVKSELMDTVNVEFEFAWSGPFKRRYGVQRSQVCVMCRPDGKMVNTPLYVNRVPSPEKFLKWLRRSKAEALGKPTTTAPGAKMKKEKEKEKKKSRPDSHKPRDGRPST